MSVLGHKWFPFKWWLDENVLEPNVCTSIWIDRFRLIAYAHVTIFFVNFQKKKHTILES